MHSWAAFAEEAPELAEAGHRLLAANEVAFLGTVSAAANSR